MWMEECLNGREDGKGDFWYTWRGAGRGGGGRYDHGAFFTSKNAIFLFGHSFEHDK